MLGKCWIAFIDVDAGTAFISLVGAEAEETLAWVRGRDIKTHGALFPGCFWFVCLSKPNLWKGFLFDLCGLLIWLELWKVAIHDLQESASGDGKSTFPTFIAHFIFLSEKENISRKRVLREVGCGISDCKDTTWTACSSRLTVCLSGCLSFKNICALLCKGRAEDY